MLKQMPLLVNVNFSIERLDVLLMQVQSIFQEFHLLLKIKLLMIGVAEVAIHCTWEVVKHVDVFVDRACLTNAKPDVN